MLFLFARAAGNEVSHFERTYSSVNYILHYKYKENMIHTKLISNLQYKHNHSSCTFVDR